MSSNIVAPSTQIMTSVVIDDYFDPNPNVKATSNIANANINSLVNNAPNPNLNKTQIAEKNIKKSCCECETAIKCCECFAEAVGQCCAVTAKGAYGLLICSMALK